eukprot:8953757-Pyramimonas_sp.AAC.1
MGGARAGRGARVLMHAHIAEAGQHGHRVSCHIARLQAHIYRRGEGGIVPRCLPRPHAERVEIARTSHAE